MRGSALIEVMIAMAILATVSLGGIHYAVVMMVWSQKSVEQSERVMQRVSKREVRYLDGA